MIVFKNLIPYPLAGTDLSDSGLWSSEEQSISKEECVLIHSPSGRGKTSLLSFLYGMRKDFDGQLELFGQDILNYSSNEWEYFRKEKLSAMFQGLRLFNSLSAYENIELKNNLTSFKTDVEIRQMINALELEPYINQRLGTLSFGQQQRVALIRALCQPFQLILLDEPFSHIDKALQIKAWELILNESKKQKASVIITLLHPVDFVKPDKIITI